MFRSYAVPFCRYLGRRDTSGFGCARCRSCGSRRAAHGENAAVVAVRQLLQRRPARRLVASLCLAGVREGGYAFLRGRRGSCLRAVHVRIRSRSTSAKPPNTASIKRPVLVPVSAHGSASDRNWGLWSPRCALTIANKSNVLRPSRSMRVTVTTSPGASRSSILLTGGGRGHRRAPIRGKNSGRSYRNVNRHGSLIAGIRE